MQKSLNNSKKFKLQGGGGLNKTEQNLFDSLLAKKYQSNPEKKINNSNDDNIEKEIAAGLVGRTVDQMFNKKGDGKGNSDLIPIGRNVLFNKIDKNDKITKSKNSNNPTKSNVLTLSDDDDDNQSKTISLGGGILNSSTQCYFISVIQLIRVIEPLESQLRNYEGECKKLRALSKVFKILSLDMEVPLEGIDKVSRIFEFGSGQQDASEALMKILNAAAADPNISLDSLIIKHDTWMLDVRSKQGKEQPDTPGYVLLEGNNYPVLGVDKRENGDFVIRELKSTSRYLLTMDTDRFGVNGKKSLHQSKNENVKQIDCLGVSYSKVAYVAHRGETLSSGHYWCCRNLKGSLQKCDDSLITKLDGENLPRDASRTYILLYELIDNKDMKSENNKKGNVIELSDSEDGDDTMGRLSYKDVVAKKRQRLRTSVEDNKTEPLTISPLTKTKFEFPTLSNSQQSVVTESSIKEQSKAIKRLDLLPPQPGAALVGKERKNTNTYVCFECGELEKDKFCSKSYTGIRAAISHYMDNHPTLTHLYYQGSFFKCCSLGNSLEREADMDKIKVLEQKLEERLKTSDKLEFKNLLGGV